MNLRNKLTTDKAFFIAKIEVDKDCYRIEVVAEKSKMTQALDLENTLPASLIKRYKVLKLKVREI